VVRQLCIKRLIKQMSFKRCYRTGNDDDAEMSSVSKSFHKQGAATLKV